MPKVFFGVMLFTSNENARNQRLAGLKAKHEVSSIEFRVSVGSR